MNFFFFFFFFSDPCALEPAPRLCCATLLTLRSLSRPSLHRARCVGQYVHTTPLQKAFVYTHSYPTHPTAQEGQLLRPAVPSHLWPHCEHRRQPAQSAGRCSYVAYKRTIEAAQVELHLLHAGMQTQPKKNCLEPASIHNMAANKPFFPLLRSPSAKSIDPTSNEPHK